MSDINYREFEREIPFNKRGEYSQICKCGRKAIVYTQPDRNPECYTTVFTICFCGENLEWSLPVN